MTTKSGGEVRSASAFTDMLPSIAGYRELTRLIDPVKPAVRKFRSTARPSDFSRRLPPTTAIDPGFKSFSSLYVDMPRSHQEQPGYRDIGASAGELPIVTRLTGLQRRTFWALGGLAIRFR